MTSRTFATRSGTDRAVRSRRIERCPSCKFAAWEKIRPPRGGERGRLRSRARRGRRPARTQRRRQDHQLPHDDRPDRRRRRHRSIFDDRDVTKLPMYLRAAPAWATSRRIPASFASSPSKTT